MTPAPETVVEYHLQCFCGAPIVATEKTASCANCGLTFEIRRRAHRHRRKRTHHRWYSAARIGADDVLQLVEKPMTYSILYSLLAYYLYDLLSC